MMKKPLVGIIDISINNILSIKRTFEHIGSEVMVINEQKEIKKNKRSGIRHIHHPH